MRTAARSGYPGLALALFSGATFGLSGSFGTSLLDVGWSPLGVVFGRLAGAAIMLGVPLAYVLIRGWRAGDGHLRTILIYGVTAVAGAQVCFFNAVTHLSVGVALLLEYLAPVLLLGWTWWRTGRAPARLTALGAVVAIAGLTLVLEVFGDTRISLVGVFWGLGAALCLSVYFQISAREQSPPPLVLTAGGLVVGTITVAAVGVAGILPFELTTAETELAGDPVPWWVIVLLLAGVSTVAAYLSGIMAIARLGSRIASFVGLTEVLFALAGAWWLVAERPTLQQLAGGVLVVTGIAVIRYAERPAALLRKADRDQALP